MNRTLIGILVVSILCISAVLGWIFLRTGTVVSPPPTPVDLVMPTMSSGETALVEDMKQAEVARAKEREELDKMREIMDLAWNEGNLDTCSTIPREDIQRECRAKVTLKNAANSGNPELCDTLGEAERPECLDATYLSMSMGAAMTGSPTERREYCDKISALEERRICTETVERLILEDMASKGEAFTANVCQNFSSTGAREGCQSRVENERAQEVTTQAAKSSDEQACLGLPDPALQDRCLDSVKYTSAKKETNPALCKEIKNADMQVQCLSQIQKISDETKYREALSLSDSNICDVISDVSLRSDCSMKISLRKAVNTGNLESCSSLDPSQVALCRQSIEILNNR